VTRYTDGVKFGVEECNEGPLLLATFHPIGATIRIQDPKSEIFTEILLNFGI